ncbi:MAG: T9SS type A sorting domain-containing protein [Flavobacteriaceae bacterium]
MKRSILTLGMLALGFLTKAQTTDNTYVANGVEMTIAPEVIYSVIDGRMTIVGTGKITNSGNVMLVNGNEDKGGFRTLTTTGLPKTDGGNFILKMYDANLSNLRYGQLYIANHGTQAPITGVVDKEYKDNHHGSYQQIALPFVDKKLSELSAELLSPGDNFKFGGGGNRANRYSGEAIMLYNNAYARFDDVWATQKTDNTFTNYGYYILGTKKFNASAAVKTVRGVPQAQAPGVGVSSSWLRSDVVFGTGGKNQNYYRERYNTYIQDEWEATTPWTGNFGKNLYMFANPFLTNLDYINQLPQMTNNDILGIRLDPGTVTTASGGGTQSTGAKQVTYDLLGNPAGDVGLVIKPMQTFVLKFRNGNFHNIFFHNMRRFAYTARPYLTSPSVLSRGSAGSLKQLGVIALDEHGNELGRTYYVVSPNAQTGKPTTYSTQVAAGSQNIIGTFEEKPAGGIDEELQNSYWLYINEANQSDFKGKEIPLKIYSDKVRALKFEVRENAVEVPDSQEKFRNGQSFYISKGNDLVTVGHNKTIPVSASDNSFGLFYGKPSGYNDVSAANVAKPSATVVAFDEATKEYKIFFDPAWNTAKVEVYDLSGRLIYSKDKVDAKAGEFTLSLPSGNRATYVVKAVSETGSVFSQKIIK